MHKRIFIFLNLLLISNLGLAESIQKIPELPNFSSLAEQVTPAVVNVSVTKVIKSPAQGDMRRGPFNDPFFDEFFKRQFGDNFKPQPRKGLGSGFIYKSTGLIVTNFHVIENADEIEIVLYNEKKYKANIVGTDKRR